MKPIAMPECPPRLFRDKEQWAKGWNWATVEIGKADSRERHAVAARLVRKAKERQDQAKWGRGDWSKRRDFAFWSAVFAAGKATVDALMEEETQQIEEHFAQQHYHSFPSTHPGVTGYIDVFVDGSGASANLTYRGITFVFNYLNGVRAHRLGTPTKSEGAFARKVAESVLGRAYQELLDEHTTPEWRRLNAEMYADVKGNPAGLEPGSYRFAWHCTSPPEKHTAQAEAETGYDLIDYIMERAEPISASAFARAVGGWRTVRDDWYGGFPSDGNIGRDAKFMRNDSTVSWYRSHYPDGTPIVFHTASGIEHVYELSPRDNPPRERAIPPMPDRWWQKKPPAADAVCYRTKTDALNKFLTFNWRAVEEWGGPGREDLPSEFDAINARYGLKGSRRITTLAQAAWWALPGPAPWCLANIDVDLLNQTSPGIHAQRELGVGFEIPDYAQELELAKGEEVWFRKQGEEPRKWKCTYPVGVEVPTPDVPF